MQPAEIRLVTEGLIEDPASKVRGILNKVFLRSSAYDTFADVANGTRPDIADSGHVWGYHEDEWAEVRDGYLDAKLDKTVTYPELALGSPVTHFGTEFLYDEMGGTRTVSGSLTLVSWNDGGVAANSTGRGTRCHISLTKTAISYWVRPKNSPGAALEVIHTANLATPLVSGQHYRFEVYLEGDTATVVPPTGEPYTVTDARIDSDDQFACWEPFYAADQQSVRSRFRMASVWADTTPIRAAMSAPVALKISELEREAPVAPASVAAQQYLSPSDITVTTTNTVIPGIEITATAGPTGKIIWELEAPIAQSGGDGPVGSGSVWFGVTTPGSNVFSPDFRAAWATQVGPVRRRYVQSGLTPGQAYTKAPFIRKDAGAGTTIINQQRAIVFTGTPA